MRYELAIPFCERRSVTKFIEVAKQAVRENNAGLFVVHGYVSETQLVPGRASANPNVECEDILWRLKRIPRFLRLTDPKRLREELVRVGLAKRRITE